MATRSSRATTITVQGTSRDAPATVRMYRCRLPLEQLRDTASPDVKYCDQCARSVFRAYDVGGMLQLVASDSCSWVDRGDGDVLLGAVASME